MSIFAKNDRQITLLFSGNTQIGKKVLALIQASKFSAHTIDISKTNLGNASWAEIAERLGMEIKDLIDPSQIKMDESANYNADDWLKVLNNNDSALAGPIAVKGDRITLMKSYTEILKFFEVDSAGLEKTMHTSPPAIQKTTNGENFTE